MKILITGGSGFIGSHLAVDLSKEHEVIVFDILQGEAENTRLTFIKGDLTNPLDLNSIQGVEGIIHLAAISRVSDAEKDPGKCLSINLIGTTNILELAKRLNCWVILGSTVESPVNIYGLSKYFCEILAERYYNVHNLKILTLKFSSVYGSPKDNKEKVIPKIIAQAQSNQEIILKNSQKHFDFVYISDLVNGIYLAVKYIEKKEPFYDSLCLCSGKQVPFKKVAEEIIKNLGSSSKLTILSSSPEKTSLTDSKKAEDTLGFKAKVDFQEGIRKTIYDLNIKMDERS